MQRSFIAAWVCAGILAGCAFTPPGPADEGQPGTIVDDTAQDFRNPLAISEAVIDPRGAIEPATYAVGGLHMAAYPRVLLAGNTTTWAQIEALMQTAPPTGTRLAMIPDVDFGDARPYGVGLKVNDVFSLVFTGEIYLEAPVTFTLESDGPGLVQIDTDGAFGYSLYDDVTIGPSARLITPPAPGWYPIRGVLTDNIGGAVFRLRTMAGAIPTTQLRSRTTLEHGLVVEGFDRPLLVGPAGIGVETGDLARDFGAAVPTWDLEISAATPYGARLRGVWLVETPGAYRLGAQVDADDQVRIWLDGKVISSKWGPGDPYESSAAIELAAGWHDLAVDLGGVGARSGFSIQILEGPPGAATGVIPSRLLRPVVRFGRIEAVDAGSSPGMILDNTTTTLPLPAPSAGVPAGAIVQAVDVGFALGHTAPVQVTIALTHPDGTGTTLRLNDPTSRAFDLYGALTPFNGKPLTAAAPWKFVVRDSAAGNTGSLTGMMAVYSYRAGEPPVAMQAGYESMPRALPEGAIEITAARALPAPPAGATIAISIRTCADAESCAAEAWQPVTGEMAIPAAPVLQYRLELGSDGWAIPSVDRVEIEYRAR